MPVNPVMHRQTDRHICPSVEHFVYDANCDWICFSWYDSNNCNCFNCFVIWAKLCLPSWQILKCEKWKTKIRLITMLSGTKIKIILLSCRKTKPCWVIIIFWVSRLRLWIKFVSLSLFLCLSEICYAYVMQYFLKTEHHIRQFNASIRWEGGGGPVGALETSQLNLVFMV